MFTTVLLFYAPVMLGSLLWNGLACLLVFRRRRLDPRRFRYLYYLVLLLMLPGLICDVGGMSPDAAIMLRAAWLYPGVFFLAALASIALLRRDGFRWWLVPVPLLNLWLAVIYLTRYLGYLGIPPGLAFEGMQVAYAIVQSLSVIFLYIFFPILNLWPVLLLPASPVRNRVRRLNLLPAVLCLLFLGVNVILLPRGYQIAASWHRPLAPESQPQGRSDFRGGVVLRVKSDPFPTEDHFQRQLRGRQGVVRAGLPKRFAGRRCGLQLLRDVSDPGGNGGRVVESPRVDRTARARPGTLGVRVRPIAVDHGWRAGPKPLHSACNRLGHVATGHAGRVRLRPG
jgi:hypothetical protein